MTLTANSYSLGTHKSQEVTLQSGKKAQAYITVKHTITTDGRRIYSLETMNIKKAPTEAGARARSFSQSVTSSSHNSIIDKNKEMSREKGQKSDFDILKSKYQNAKAIVGNKASYYTANGDKIKGVWKLVEAQTPQASHDESTFNTTKGFYRIDKTKHTREK